MAEESDGASHPPENKTEEESRPEHSDTGKDETKKPRRQDGPDKNKKDDEKTKPESESGNDHQKKEQAKPLWPWIVAGGIALLFLLVVLLIILLPHSKQETDDAYVTAHFAVVSPRIPGQVSQVLVTDNQQVRAGQLLVKLDDRDQVATLAQARGTLDSDKSRLAEASAQVEAATARLSLGESDASRYTHLAATGAGTIQQGQQASVTLTQDEAALKSAQAMLGEAQGRIVVDQAQVDQAELNLSYTRIIAPIEGTVDQRSVQVGNYLTPGTPVMILVPLNDIYIAANYRELALRHMRPGQHVSIHVDAYDIYLDGMVDSIPPSSGAAYSPIPPNNATGNFTKIVQRLPVKIIFAPHQRLTELVRVGMSVETTVDTHLENVVSEQQQQDRRVTGRGP
jgi:membrane fusion protein (multidrug efflux system)